MTAAVRVPALSLGVTESIPTPGLRGPLDRPGLGRAEVSWGQGASFGGQLLLAQLKGPLGHSPGGSVLLPSACPSRTLHPTLLYIGGKLRHRARAWLAQDCTHVSLLKPAHLLCCFSP